MNGRRTSIQIMAEVLRLADGEGMGKTGIMYAANMSHSQLGKYLSFLTEKGFLQQCNGAGRGRYLTTTEGQKLLKQIDEMSEVLELDIPQTGNQMRGIAPN